MRWSPAKPFPASETVVPQVADGSVARPVERRGSGSGVGGDRFVPGRVALSPAFEVSKRPSPLQRLGHLWQYRELLGNLVRKELKVTYKNSVLGFVWSLLNPVLYLVVFSVVFQIVLQVKVPYFAIFFLSGLLAWNFFSVGLSNGTTAIVGNAQLVTKVWFPREALVLASVGAAIVHFFLQSLVLFAALLIFMRTPSLEYFPALPVALVVLVLFASALAIALSAINVYLRDTQHLLELVLVAWFWVSAIVYPYFNIAKRLGPRWEWLASLNPILPIVVTFQRVIYNPTFGPGCKTLTSDSPCTAALPDHGLGWYLTHLGAVGLFSLVLLYGSLRLFSRLEDNFAEEI
jgi:ABC-2 type transport system permease protein